LFKSYLIIIQIKFDKLIHNFSTQSTHLTNEMTQRFGFIKHITHKQRTILDIWRGKGGNNETCSISFIIFTYPFIKKWSSSWEYLISWQQGE